MRWSKAVASAGLFFCLCLLHATSAWALTIDFESLPAGGCLATDTPVSTQGFTFSTPASNFFVCNSTRANLPSNGTITIGSEQPTVTTMTRDGGGTFPLVSIDLAELFVGLPAADQVQIDGSLAGGGVVSVTFDLDGINDGPGGLDDFETFLLPGGFSDLTSVVFTGLNSQGQDPRFTFDNVVVPEPATALLLCGGMVALAARRRSRPATR